MRCPVRPVVGGAGPMLGEKQLSVAREPLARIYHFQNWSCSIGSKTWLTAIIVVQTLLP